VVFYKSISQPDLWSGNNLIAFLKQRGITVRGQVRRGVAPAKAAALAMYESKPLALIIADMQKFSNNYVAEMLVKNLAAENGVVPATMPAGMSQLEKFLNRIGLKKGDYKFINASGFSRENKMAPEHIGRILEAIREDFSSYPEFLTSLPIGGVDGTLKNRMKNTGAERWVRAKTGLLNGAVALAGYAGLANGTVRSFAFLYNGPGREDQARALFDRMAAALVEAE
jgi:D-alanyl-D-alanine carboxypeptidase/D-alanyl-D-alanine-endopeptidase (penicillin-binding protein 4)